VAAANVTAWSSLVSELEMPDSKLAKSHLVAISEHRLGTMDQVAGAQRRLAALGWKGHFTLAGKGPKGRASAGVAWIWQEWVQASMVEQLRGDARHVCVQVRGMRCGAINAVAVYGWVDDVNRTLAMTERRGLQMRALGRPWMMAGDWNIPATTMSRWLAENGNWAQVRSCGATCMSGAGTGSAIDYFLLRNGMDGLVEDVSSLDSSLATHRPARMTLVAPARQLVEVMVQAKSPGFEFVPGKVVSNGVEMGVLHKRVDDGRVRPAGKLGRFSQ